MKKLKLMTILGTRPEIIKMSEIIKKSDRYFNNVLVHTGQNSTIHSMRCSSKILDLDSLIII